MKRYLIILAVAFLWKYSKPKEIIIQLDKDEMDRWIHTGLTDLGYVVKENEVQDITDVFCAYVQIKGGKA